jgi:hypothetical protein
MKYYQILFVGLIVNVLPLIVHAQEITPPDPSRVKAYEKMLPASPRGIGTPISDRTVWDELAKLPAAVGVVKEAEKILKIPMPVATDELYLDFSRTGTRTRYEAVATKRHDRVGLLVLAECLENRGRFLPGIEEAITSICGDKSWLLPAHDRQLKNFNGEEITIDLASADTSWNLATADYWLGDKLSPSVRNLIADELERRTFTPFEKTINTGTPRLFWLSITNNWNAVCLADVTGTALASIKSPERRAFFAASAEKYIENFLKGFTPDGYCTEGIGYWSYGFGHYVLLAETIKQATDGKVDLLTDKRIEPIVLFGKRMEILPGVYPAFADSDVGGKPDVALMGFLSRRFGLGWKEIEKESLKADILLKVRLFKFGIIGMQNASADVGAAGLDSTQPLRDWFSDAGILICRPKSYNDRALGVALKGGHNAEHHNHNDVGSFVVALGNSTPLVDPGREVYTARTFDGANRYKSDVLNSFGHSVPRVAGTLQVTGREAHAKILKTLFTDAEDTLVMDISSAYKVPGLKKLVRTFVFSREGKGKLTVIDEVEFEQPKNFGTALITFAKRQQPEPDRLIIGEGDDAVEVVVTATGGDFRIDSHSIDENLPGKRIPVRLGVDFTQPVREGSISVTITPK